MNRTVPPEFRFAARAVAIGASAGGIDALFTLLEGWPGGEARPPLIAVLHLPQDHRSTLAELFTARLGFTVEEARPGAPLMPGRLHLAPPGYHLLVEKDGTLSLDCDAPVLYSRPSIDVLFESCADAFGDRLCALVLSGANEDGAAGLARVRSRGGLTAVQDPATAAHPTMPSAALRAADPHFVLPLPDLRTLMHTFSLEALDD